MEKIPKVAILIRLRPNAKELLDKACRERQRSRSILIDQLITEVLTREYADLHSRLDDLVARQSA